MVLLIICIKLYVNQYEYMTTDDNVTDLINIGYTPETANKILLDKSSICAVPEQSGANGIGMLTLNETETNELSFKDYKLKIVSGQQFHEKLDSIEEEVFSKFYGPDESTWRPEYNKSLLRRKQQTEKKLSDKCLGIRDDAAFTIESLNQKLITLSYLERIHTDTNTNNYITGTGGTDPELSIRKIQYRSIEEDKLQLYNMYMNWLYYLILTTILLVLFSKSKLNIQKNWLTYILLVLLPVIIYPYTFKICQYIVDYSYTTTKDQLPSNAFMND